MPSPIFARADALIQRLRPASTEVDDVPVLIDAIEPAATIVERMVDEAARRLQGQGGATLS